MIRILQFETDAKGLKRRVSTKVACFPLEARHLLQALQKATAAPPEIVTDDEWVHVRFSRVPICQRLGSVSTSPGVHAWVACGDGDGFLAPFTGLPTPLLAFECRILTRTNACKAKPKPGEPGYLIGRHA